MEPESSRDPFELLRTWSAEELPEHLARLILAFRNDAVPKLMEMAESSERWWDDETHKWGGAHAIRLLVELRVPATYRTLLEIFVRTLGTDDFYGWEACMRHVPKLGVPMLDYGFDFLREHAEYERSLVYLLAEFEEDDARVLSLLTRLVESDPEDVASVVYSDPHPSWIPVLVRCLEKLNPAPMHVALGLDVALALVDLAHGVPRHLTEKIIGWETAWFAQYPRWCDALVFGRAGILHGAREVAGIG